MSLSEQHTDNSATGNQAKTIFLAALEIQGDAERQALLDERCGDNQALRREVERLLNHEGDVGSFLESPPPGVVSSADATADYCTVPAPFSAL